MPERDTQENSYKYGYHVVAFIDVLGQRAQLAKLSDLKPTTSRDDTRWQTLQEGAHQVQVVRSAFATSFEAAQAAPSHEVPEVHREFALRLRRFKYSQMGFSDTVVISVPIHQETDSFAVAATGLYATLYSMAAVMLIALGRGIPLRAGIDAGTGMIGMLDNDEVYGPVFLSAYALENSKAEYPRAVVGEGLLNYLDSLEKLPGTHPGVGHGDLAARRAADCRELLCNAPDDKRTMLHILSSVITKSVRPHTARAWVHEEYESHRAAGNDKLTERYRRLLDYFDAYE